MLPPQCRAPGDADHRVPALARSTELFARPDRPRGKEMEETQLGTLGSNRAACAAPHLFALWFLWRREGQRRSFASHHDTTLPELKNLSHEIEKALENGDVLDTAVGGAAR